MDLCFLLVDKTLIRTSKVYYVLEQEDNVNSLHLIMPPFVFGRNLSLLKPYLEISVPNGVGQDMCNMEVSYDIEPYKIGYLSITVPVLGWMTKREGTVSIRVIFRDPSTANEEVVFKSTTSTFQVLDANSKEVIGYKPPGGGGGEGYHPPIEVRKKISEHHADVSGGNNPFAKKVYQFTLNGVYINNYESVSIAGKQFNSKGRSISHAAVYNKMAFGYLWAYDDNIIKKNNTYELKEYKYVPKRLTNKRVFGFDKNTKELIYDFESCVIASRETNIKKENISGCACYKFKTSKTDNYIWRYEKDVGFTEDGKAYFIA